MIKKLSVFFPSYNEEGNIETAVKKAVEVLKKLNLDYEIIVVNDGSLDKTGKIADNLARTNPKVRVIHHPKNLGYGEALKSGFYGVKYDTIVYTDGDGQFDFSEVTKFLEKIEDYDLVIGFRIKRRDPFFRILFAKGWALSLFTFFRLTLKDVDCGFKMVKKQVLEKISHLESQRGAMINAELAIKAKNFGFKIGQVGVNHFPRLSGRPTGANLNVIIKSFIDLIRLWWKLKQQKWVFLSLLLILVLASFLRFYKLSEYMTFLGDEGRDAIIIKNMLVKLDFPSIGPPTSVGNIYLGPLYYYMMAVSMAIVWLNPVAAAGMNATVGVATVYLIYYLGKEWFSKLSGLIAAYLYAISPVNIIYSKSSWNPNPVPLFALLGMFSLYKVNKTGNFLWLILTGLAFAAALQMHYLVLILLPIAGILWGYEIWSKSKESSIKHLFKGTVLGVATFLLMMSPLLLFDLKHNFLNYRAITQLLTEGGAVKTDIISNLIRIPQLYSYNLIGRLLTGENYFLQIIVSLILLLPFIFLRKWSTFVLATWLFVGLLGISFYQQSIYDHYLGFMNPTPFLLFGSLVMIKIIPQSLTKFLLIILISALTYVNLQQNPLHNPPNRQLQRTQEVAKFIISQAENQDFNFALIAQRNYDAAYQFYLDQYGHKPKMVPFDITDQLFVVCEDQVCDPTHSPKYEIAAYGWSKIEWQQERFGVKIYKLVSNPSGKP